MAAGCDNLNCDDLVATYEAETLARSKPRTRAPKEPEEKKSKTHGLERSYLGKLLAFSPATAQWMKKPVYGVAGSTYIVGRVCYYKYIKKQGCTNCGGWIPCSRMKSSNLI